MDGLKKLNSLKDPSRKCDEGDKECIEDKYFGRVPNEQFRHEANLGEKECVPPHLELYQRLKRSARFMKEPQDVYIGPR